MPLPDRDRLMRSLQVEVSPPVEPATVTGASGARVAVSVGAGGGTATVIDYPGPEALAPGDFVWVQRIARDPFGRYRYIGRRVEAGGTIRSAVNPVTGLPQATTLSSTITITAMPAEVTDELADHEERLDALEEGGSGGHIIVDEDGEEYPMRSRLRFMSGFIIDDDEDADETRISWRSPMGLGFDAPLGFNAPRGFNG